MLVQGCLLDLDPRGIDESALAMGMEHLALGSGAWIEVCRGWLTGTAALFEELVRIVPWRAEQRPMYERVVDVPRLTCFYRADDALPAAALARARHALNAHYDPMGDDPFATAGLCLYRDGRDSVAWHGDRIGRGSSEDVRVAIISLGATRSLLVRPRGGGRSLRFALGSGDLLVMGGSCQRTFEHSVPKTTHTVGARMSVQFRPGGVR